MLDLTFSRNLIKGRIAETIFEEMFKQSEEFTVIPIGYEHTVPELAQYQHHVQVKRVLDNIRSAPDFALVSQNKENVFMVEVKYRYKVDFDEILCVAKRLNTSWNPCFLFIVTPQNFYFDSCSQITEKSTMFKLSDNWINRSLQNRYLALVREFLP